MENITGLFFDGFEVIHVRLSHLSHTNTQWKHFNCAAGKPFFYRDPDPQALTLLYGRDDIYSRIRRLTCSANKWPLTENVKRLSRITSPNRREQKTSSGSGARKKQAYPLCAINMFSLHPTGGYKYARTGRTERGDVFYAVVILHPLDRVVKLFTMCFLLYGINTREIFLLHNIYFFTPGVLTTYWFYTTWLGV